MIPSKGIPAKGVPSGKKAVPVEQPVEKVAKPKRTRKTDKVAEAVEE